MRKFLQKWPLVFALPSADGIALTAAALECELGQAQKIKHASTDKPAAKAATSAAAIDESDVAGSQWFRLDDNTASCIDYKEVERTFQGSESAYMLFYIRRDQFDDATIPSLSEVEQPVTVGSLADSDDRSYKLWLIGRTKSLLKSERCFAASAIPTSLSYASRRTKRH